MLLQYSVLRFRRSFRIARMDVITALQPRPPPQQLERAQQRQHCATVTQILQNAGVIFRLSSRIATFRAMLAIRLGFAAQLCVACVTGPHQP